LSLAALRLSLAALILSLATLVLSLAALKLSLAALVLSSYIEFSGGTCIEFFSSGTCYDLSLAALVLSLAALLLIEFSGTYFEFRLYIDFSDTYIEFSGTYNARQTSNIFRITQIKEHNTPMWYNHFLLKQSGTSGIHKIMPPFISRDA
jgi:hypothetical protein